MKIRDYELDIDIQDELDNFGWAGAVVKGIKFIACSPFRTERHPSFACNLETGTWIDSGNSEEYYHTGNIVKLLAILRQEDYETVESYLIEKYATILRDTDALQLHLDLHGEADKPKYIQRSDLKWLKASLTEYFTGRGISTDIQELFELGATLDGKTVAMPWVDMHNNIINIKYRQIKYKAFFFEKGGQGIHRYLYGLYQCIQKKAKRVFICESEIDALTLWTHGYYAIAVGGSSLSIEQKKLLLLAGIEELIIVTDNDLVGNRFRESLKREFGGIFKLLDFEFPDDTKDINDLTKEQLDYAVANIRETIFFFLH